MPIIDQGYQHWDGELSGHAWRWLAITRRGVKTALRGRMVRWVLFMSWGPAILLASMLCLWGLIERQSASIEALLPMLTSLFGKPIMAGPKDFRVEIWTLSFHYFLSAELWFSMVLVLLAGPNLISQDLRYNALPLYLSRPLRRIDYFLGKLGIIVAIVGFAMIVPSVIAYILGLLFSLDISILRQTWPILLGAVAYGVIVALSTGLLMLAISSLSRNSRYIALFWIGIWLLSGTVSVALDLVETERRVHEGDWHGRWWDSDAYMLSEMEAAKSNWRPLLSYTSNLSRIEARLLHKNTAWGRLKELTPEGHRAPIYRRMLGTQFPWMWSAFVLAGVFVVSLVILNYSVKSLDQLK